MITDETLWELCKDNKIDFKDIEKFIPIIEEAVTMSNMATLDYLSYDLEKQTLPPEDSVNYTYNDGLADAKVRVKMIRNKFKKQYDNEKKLRNY